MSQAAGVVVGAIAPHGDLAIAEACTEGTRQLAANTQRAMDEMASGVAAAGVDSLVVVTPHGIHVAGHLAVVTASGAAGALVDSAQQLSLSCTVDRELALEVSGALAQDGLPAVEVSYGGNNPAEAEMPLDWGVLIPLWHLQRHLPGVPVVIMAPARELSGGDHVRAGRAIARAAESLGRRTGFIASADQGHGHSAVGRYGFRAESATFDARVAGIVDRGTLDELCDISAEEAQAALADSWWQMLMLVGALQQTGRAYHSRLLAYEAPTYYGMLTALVEVATV